MIVELWLHRSRREKESIWICVNLSSNRPHIELGNEIEDSTSYNGENTDSEPDYRHRSDYVTEYLLQQLEMSPPDVDDLHVLF